MGQLWQLGYYEYFGTRGPIRWVSYTYNAAGRVSKVEGASGTESKTYADNFTYHPHGAWKSMNLAGGALRQSRDYNNRLQPTELKAEDLSPVNTLMRFTYGFNWGAANNGNVLFVNDYGQGNSYSYTYDELNRLKTAAASIYGPTCWGLDYGYDIWGNLLSATVTQCSAPPLSLTVNTKNQITNPGIYYDAAGNFTNGISVLLTYDAENRIAGAGTSTYVYSPAGRRVKRTVNGVTTLYMNDGPGGPALSEFTTSGQGVGAWVKDYIYLNGELLATESATQGTRYHFADHLGTPRVIADSAGTVISRHDYFPFGAEQTASSDGETHKFTGKERDVETGLDYFGARYYHSGHGKFMSPDPITIKANRLQDPQRLNLYSYVRNNPLVYVDPDGRDMQLWIVVKDQSSRQTVNQAAPKIAADFHRWGVKQVNVHVTSDPAKVVKSSNTIVVTAEKNESMTKSADYGRQSVLGGVTINTELANTPQTVRNVTDHEVTHNARGDTGLSALLGTDHSSDKNDLMYGKYDALKQSDPQLGSGTQQQLQERFNKEGDRNEATVVDEDKEKPKEQKP